MGRRSGHPFKLKFFIEGEEVSASNPAPLRPPQTCFRRCLPLGGSMKDEVGRLMIFLRYEGDGSRRAVREGRLPRPPQHVWRVTLEPGLVKRRTKTT